MIYLHCCNISLIYILAELSEVCGSLDFIKFAASFRDNGSDLFMSVQANATSN